MIVGEIYVKEFPSQGGEYRLEVAYKVTTVHSEFHADAMVIGVKVTDAKTGKLMHEMAADDARLSV